MVAALWLGVVLGFVVAAQVGPIWLFCARTTLRVGAASGMAVGLGAATVDLAYAALGAAGVTPFLGIAWLRTALGVVGGAVLVVLGVRTLRTALRVRLGHDLPEETVTPRAALRTSLAATASNPSTIVSWAAIFGAASAGSDVRGGAAAAALVLGVGAGSLAWHALLVGAMRLLRHRVGDRTLRAVDGFTGVALVAGGTLMGGRAIRGA
jgi:threonine/homoserine/homoserine lactone efflux protein